VSLVALGISGIGCGIDAGVEKFIKSGAGALCGLGISFSVDFEDETGNIGVQ
jgi:hypothetical protein